ncbi:hypothetical protein C8J57DRAFT_1461369, partial [Mycena rebaudengoi]
MFTDNRIASRVERSVHCVLSLVSTAQSRGQATCDPCPRGSYAPNYASNYCNGVSNGWFQNYTGKAFKCGACCGWEAKGSNFNFIADELLEPRQAQFRHQLGRRMQGEQGRVHAREFLHSEFRWLLPRWLPNQLPEVIKLAPVS